MLLYIQHHFCTKKNKTNYSSPVASTCSRCCSTRLACGTWHNRDDEIHIMRCHTRHVRRRRGGGSLIAGPCYDLLLERRLQYEIFIYPLSISTLLLLFKWSCRCTAQIYFIPRGEETTLCNGNDVFSGQKKQWEDDDTRTGPDFAIKSLQKNCQSRGDDASECIWIYSLVEVLEGIIMTVIQME